MSAGAPIDLRRTRPLSRVGGAGDALRGRAGAEATISTMPADHPRPHAGNAVVYALVVALLDLEQRRTRGKVRPPMPRRPHG
jgi:hypothetical protein